MTEQPQGRASARGRQTGRDMVLSLGVVALVLLGWMYFSHPRTPDPIREVAWAGVAASAAERASYEVLAPPVAFPWPATSARVEPQSDGTLAWQVGFYTPMQDYAAVLARGVFPEQAGAAQQEWLDEQTRNGVPGETVTIGGRDWVRAVGDPTPDDRRSLVLADGGTVTVVTGSASWTELETLAGTLAPVSP